MCKIILYLNCAVSIKETFLCAPHEHLKYMCFTSFQNIFTYSMSSQRCGIVINALNLIRD